MTRRSALTPEFVEFMPKEIEEGILYVSMTYGTAIHRCCCGCGEKVVTPFSATDWKLTYDGETVSLAPSIGNWNFRCRSHYWIERNRVRWAPGWSAVHIQVGRARDQADKERYFGVSTSVAACAPACKTAQRESPLQKLYRWLTGRSKPR